MRIHSNSDPPGGSGDGSDPGSQNDQIVHNALDAVMDSEHQTYEQFLQGFLHLTAADVAPSILQEAFPGDTDDIPPLFLQPYLSPRLSTPPLVSASSDSLSVSARSSDAQNDNDVKQDPDDLEEEVLDLGCPSVDGTTALVPPKRLVQMDNFVDDEGGGGSADDEYSDIEDIGSSYQASFGCQASQRPVQQQDTEQLESSAPDSTSSSINPTQLSPPDPLTLDPTTSDPVTSDSELEILPPGGAQPREQDSTVGESEGKLVYDSRFDRLNPGEISDEGLQEASAATIVQMTNQCQMQYSARFAKPGEKPSSQSYKDSHEESIIPDAVDDVVKPFALDTDFDYDSVVLTPRFTGKDTTEGDEIREKE